MTKRDIATWPSFIAIRYAHRSVLTLSDKESILKLYRLPVYDGQGKTLPAEAIYNHLKKLANETEEPAKAIGHLTADERQLSAPIYEQLSASEISSWKRVHALFCCF